MDLHSDSNKTVILGAGITGLTIAEALSRRLGSRVLVLEKENFVGGLAVTYHVDNLSFDVGSHRLHMDTSRKAVTYIQDHLGVKLLKRQRHGLLAFRGRFVNYPPTLFNLLRCFSGRELAAFSRDFLKERIRPGKAGQDFEAAMIRAAGRQFYNVFYKSYAKKLWGIEPHRVSAEAKRKRTVFSYKMLFSSIFNARRYYLYPRDGMGAIANKLEECIRSNGAEIIKSADIKNIAADGRRVTEITFTDRQGHPHSIGVENLISTIPADDLYGLLPEHRTTEGLSWRGIRLGHILVDQRLPGECETYYCPESDVSIGRVSNISRYSPHLNSQAAGTLLTVELPTTPGDSTWSLEEKALLDLCLSELVKTNVLPERPRVNQAYYTKLAKVYPIYVLGWEDIFSQIYENIRKRDNLFSVGRNGLFLHCNVDHCIEQGLALADHIMNPRGADRAHWEHCVEKFLSFSARD